MDPCRAGGQGGGSGLRSPDAWCVPCTPAWCCQVSGKGAPGRASAPAKAQRCRSHQSERPATGESRAGLGWGGPRQRGDQPSARRLEGSPAGQASAAADGGDVQPTEGLRGKESGQGTAEVPEAGRAETTMRVCVGDAVPSPWGLPELANQPARMTPRPLKWTSNLALFLSVLTCRPPRGAEFWRSWVKVSPSGSHKLSQPLRTKGWASSHPPLFKKLIVYLLETSGLKW